MKIKVPTYTNAITFADQVGKYVISAGSEFGATQKFRVSVSGRETPGKRTLYEMSALARHNRRPIAKYVDNSPRPHDSEISPKLDLNAEAREFAIDLAEIFEQKGVKTKVNNLEIDLKLEKHLNQ